MKLVVQRGHFLYPGAMVEVDFETYVVEEVEPDYSAPRHIMEMGGGPYGEPVAMPSQDTLHLRPISETEEQERRRLYDAEQAEKVRPKWWERIIGRQTVTKTVTDPPDGVG